MNICAFKWTPNSRLELPFTRLETNLKGLWCADAQECQPCFGCERLRVRVPSVPLLNWKLSVLEIPLDKELTANCLVETRTILEELIPAAMVNMIWIGYSSPCGCSSPWLMVSHGMVYLEPQWSGNICKVCWGCVELHVRGRSTPWGSTLKITCRHVFFYFWSDSLLQDNSVGHWSGRIYQFSSSHKHRPTHPIPHTG